MSRIGHPVRWAIAAVAVAVAVPIAIAVLVDGDEANGGGGARSGAWTTLPHSPLERTEVGAARIGRFIYVVGGFIPPDLTTTGRVLRYDIDSGTWTEVAPLPIGVNHPAVAAGAGRCKGDIYVYGGYAASASLAGETDALQRFDPAGGAWTVLDGSGIARGAASLASVGCSLYATGGAAGGNALRTVQIYDIRRAGWRAGPSMRDAREHHASVAIGGRVLVFAGRDFGGNLDAAEQLDTRKGKWRRLPPVPTPRSGFGAAAVHGRAVVVGGEQLAEGTETIRPVEVFDPRTRRWRKLPGMITPRHGLGVVSRAPARIRDRGGSVPRWFLLGRGRDASPTLPALRIVPVGVSRRPVGVAILGGP